MDHGPQPAREEQGGDVEELGLASHVASKERELLGEEVAQVRHAPGSGGGAAGDQASAVREGQDRALPGGLADVLDHYNRAPKAAAGHTELTPLGLNRGELRQLEAFLKTLTGPVLVNREPVQRSKP